MAMIAAPDTGHCTRESACKLAGSMPETKSAAVFHELRPEGGEKELETGVVEVGVWAAPVGATETVDAVVGHGDRHNRYGVAAQQRNQIVDRDGKSSVGFCGRWHVIAQQPEVLNEFVVPGQDDHATAGDTQHLSDPGGEISPVVNGQDR